MTEQNKEKLHIKLHVYDEEIDVTVNRSDEEYYRSAAEFVTDRYNLYAEGYKGHISDHTISLYVLIDIALRYKMLVADKDTDKYNDILKQLTAMIDDALEHNSKDSELKVKSEY